MNNRCFVKSMAQVSCQKPLCDEWFDSPCLYAESYVRAIEPDTKGFILPAEARRMSKILKRTVCTSIDALNKSGIDHPDAIITGTGMGCMENSEKFLIDLSRYGESCLKPTLFMQSTHNTISSLISIILKCHGYNNTYSHKGISFESALLDAWMQIRGGMIRSALIGAHDEVTPFMRLVMERTHPEYSFVSESSMSAMLSSGKDDDSICEIEDVRIFHRPDPDEIASILSEEADEMLILGLNGNELNDRPYEEMLARLSFSPAILRYKHIFGDNFSSPAMSFLAGATILSRGCAPDFMKCNSDDTFPVNIKRITLINHSDSSEWSMIRLKSCCN